MFAICYTRPDTTLTFWLNRFHHGGFIWSLVRTPRTWMHVGSLNDHQYWNQPPLRFPTREAAAAFVLSELSGNSLARIVEVTD